MSEKLIFTLMVLLEFVASKRRNKYTGRESKKNPKYQNQELDDILRRYWPQDVKFYIDPYYFFRLALAVHLFWGLRHFGMCLFARNYSSTLEGALRNFQRKKKANIRDILLYIGVFMILYLTICFHQFVAFSRPLVILAFTHLINHFHYNDH